MSLKLETNDPLRTPHTDTPIGPRGDGPTLIPFDVLDIALVVRELALPFVRAEVVDDTVEGALGAKEGEIVLGFGVEGDGAETSVDSLTAGYDVDSSYTVEGRVASR